jgi:preprotein translocase subunit YajC
VSGFLILIVVLGGLWALFVLPSKRRKNQHAAMQDSIEAGDEIITAGGLHGMVKEIDDDTARIEIAPGVVATLDRRAIAAVAREVEVEVEHAADEAGDEMPETLSEPR